MLLKRYDFIEAEVTAKVDTLARALTDLLVLRGDEPSDHALTSIESCHSALKLAA